jgi:hypothetical protein
MMSKQKEIEQQKNSGRKEMKNEPSNDARLTTPIGKSASVRPLAPPNDHHERHSLTICSK